jgi:hypothetical protein
MPLMPKNKNYNRRCTEANPQQPNRSPLKMFQLRDFRQLQIEKELEGLDELLEKLKPSDPTSKYIHDFVHSDNPKFAGKSKKERIRMALGAKYGAMRKMKQG